MRFLSNLRTLVGIMVLLLLPVVAKAAEFNVDRQQSVFSMVTHKAGIAARLAHEHLIYPGTYTINVTTGDAASADDAIRAGHFDLQFLAKDLVVDDPVAKQHWSSGIRKLQILDKPFPHVPEDARKKIYATMLSSEQLDAAVFPEISARMLNIEPRSGAGEGAYTVQMEMTVHGRTVTRPCIAKISLQGDTLKVEATGRFKFTDFGIKPYSAFLGAIRNQDGFDLYVNFVATK